MTLPTLYKMTQTGKVQQWTIIVTGGSYHTESGQSDGKLTVSAPTTCKGKNLGKANATTPESQAEADAKAKWQKKVDSGYGETIEESQAARADRIEPMLAETWEDAENEAGGKHKMTYPCISQAKLDGVRCIVTREYMMSRKWKPIVSCPHIFEALRQLFVDHPDLIALDGELYNHKFHAEFHEIISLVRKTKPTEEDLASSRELIEYHVYDVILKENKSNISRDFWLFQNVKGRFDKVEVVPSLLVANLEDLDTEYERLMSLGYEGQIVRRGAANYSHKRCYDLLKRKAFVDEEFEVVGWEECEGNRAGTFSLVCKYHDGRTFVAPLNGTVAYLKSLWPRRDEIIGERWTVTYFPPPNGALPRFPRGKSERPVSDGEPDL